MQGPTSWAPRQEPGGGRGEAWQVQGVSAQGRLCLLTAGGRFSDSTRDAPTSHHHREPGWEDMQSGVLVHPTPHLGPTGQLCPPLRPPQRLLGPLQPQPWLPFPCAQVKADQGRNTLPIRNQLPNRPPTGECLPHPRGNYFWIVLGGRGEGGGSTVL